jgi:hypothetical protein
VQPEFAVTLSPNPATDKVTIRYNGLNVSKTTSIRMVNAEGKTVKSLNIGSVQSGNTGMDVKGLAKGTYYVILENGKESKTEKLQIQ